MMMYLATRCDNERRHEPKNLKTRAVTGKHRFEDSMRRYEHPSFKCLCVWTNRHTCTQSR